LYQLQFSAEGTSLAFLYRVGACPKFYGEYFRTYLFTIDVTGHNLWRVPVAEGSFHDYGAEGRLLVSEKARCRFAEPRFCIDSCTWLVKLGDICHRGCSDGHC